MLGFLAGVPGRLKTLTDRLTSTWATKLDTLHDTRLTTGRATNLDKLDANVSTLAPASTALSTAVWSSALATSIPKIDAPPIASGLVAPPVTGYALAATEYTGLPSGSWTSITAASGSWTTVVNYTGAGYLEVIVGSGYNISSSMYLYVRITIDGNIVNATNLEGSYIGSPGGVTVYMPIWGNVIQQRYWNGTSSTMMQNGAILSKPLRFNTSLKVEAYQAGTASTKLIGVTYTKTA